MNLLVGLLLLFQNTRKEFYLCTVFGLLQIYPPLLAQSQPMDERIYEGIYITFESECCGINREAFDSLQSLLKKIQKQNPQKIQQKSFSWGKEGEQVICLLPMHRLDKDFQQIAPKVLGNFQKHTYPRVYARVLLEIELSAHKLWLHFPPYGILQKIEEKCLAYIHTLENETGQKILQGFMINETHLEADQDKRYELDLSKISEKQQEEFIQHIKTLFLCPD